MPPVIFAYESDESRSLPLSAQRLVNFFTEKQHPGSKSQTPLFGRPGMIAQAVGAGAGPIRGIWFFKGFAHFVSGEDLYRFNGGSATFLATGIGGNIDQPVSMSDNGTQLCIVNGYDGWIYTTGGGLVQITDPLFQPSQTVLFFDGYFIFSKVGTNEWFLSDLYDGLTYSSVNFATAESSSTPIIGMAKNLELLFLFKEDDIELWYDAGNPGFPFARYTGGVVTRGCLSGTSIVNQDGAIFFLGEDGVYYRLQANTPIRVSTHSVEHIIAQEPEPFLITSFTWVWEGHRFIALTLPNTKRTLVLDLTTGAWADRESFDAEGVSLGIWRANSACDLNNGVTIFGDAFGGTIGIEDWDTETEYGNPIVARAYSVPYHSDRKRVYVSRFELDIQAGVGNAAAPDPQIMLQWSKDGAQTWSMLQPWRSMGAIGAYLQRLRWLRLGQARQWVFCISISSPVRRVIIAAHMDLAVGM